MKDTSRAASAARLAFAAPALALLGVASAQASLPPGAGESALPIQEASALQDASEPARSARQAVRYVIVLEDGRVARGPAEALEGGGFRIRNGSDEWVEVAADRIAHAEPERDLQREWKSVQRDDSLAPADQLAWATDRGLLVEAFGAADELLDEHPRDGDLRVVAARLGEHVVPDDGSLEELLEAASRNGMAAREAALPRLVATGDREALLEALVADSKSKDHARRGCALYALARLFPADDARRQLLHAIWDPSPDARADAARAIGELGALEVGRPLIDALWSEHSVVRQRAAEAMATARDPMFVEPLLDRLFAIKPPRNPKVPVTRPLSAPPPGRSGGGPQRAYIFVGRQRAYIQDFDVEVAQFASVADPVINLLTEGAVLDVGVVSVTDVTVVSESKFIVRGLRQTTGQGFGTQPNKWRDWWSSEDADPYRVPAPR